jgi:hypothetical protein
VVEDSSIGNDHITVIVDNHDVLYIPSHSNTYRLGSFEELIKKVYHAGRYKDELEIISSRRYEVRT